MQIAAYLPDAQGQVPINLINDVDQSQRMYKYMNNTRNGTQMHVPNSNISQSVGSTYQSLCLSPPELITPHEAYQHHFLLDAILQLI